MKAVNNYGLTKKNEHEQSILEPSYITPYYSQLIVTMFTLILREQLISCLHSHLHYAETTISTRI